MITFSDDDEAYLDRVQSPPGTPPVVSDEDEEESSKELWYHDKSSHDNTVSITLSNPHGKHCFYAGETIEVNVTCTVRQLQLLSGVLEGFSVINGQVEETFVFQEVRLYPYQLLQLAPPLQKEPSNGKLTASGKKKLSSSTMNLFEKRFKFWITIPLTAPPSIKISSKTGIFYRVRVCGIGEVHHYHVLPHHHFAGILTPTKEASSPHIGGLGNYVPFKLRNNTCGYVGKNMVCENPQTAFTITAPVAGKDITLKVHLVGTPYAIIGQQFTCFVTLDNASYKVSKGFTIKIVRHAQTVSSGNPCTRGLRSSDDDIQHDEKSKTVVKFKFHSTEHHCAPKEKLQSQLAFRIPHTLTPTVMTNNLHYTYGLFVRADISPTSGLAQEMPLLILPVPLDLTFSFKEQLTE